MKRLSLVFVGFVTLLGACTPTHTTNNAINTTTDSLAIAIMLDSFNVAAANAEYERYFNYFTTDAVFIGTDATEHWGKQAFMLWAKPLFNKHHTWHFTAIDRHIYIHKNGTTAWFDELLNTQMKICRGSGVLVKQGDAWKIQHYVLSMTIPNANTNAVVKIKSAIEDSIITTLVYK
jgi:ketosteroid isomerase-like protein